MAWTLPRQQFRQMSQVDFDPQPRRTRRHDFVIQHCLLYASLFLMVTYMVGTATGPFVFPRHRIQCRARCLFSTDHSDGVRTEVYGLRPDDRGREAPHLGPFTFAYKAMKL